MEKWVSRSCLITSQVKGYPFEVAIQQDQEALSDTSRSSKSLDWRVRQAEFVCKLPRETAVEVLEKLGVLLFDAG
jgi:mRNA interferase MazF